MTKGVGMKNLTCYKGVGYNSFLTMGAATTYISAVMPLIRESLSLTYAQVGMIFAAKSIGYLTGALLIGILIDFIGTKKPLMFSYIFIPSGILIFTLSRSAVGLIIGHLLIGLGSAVIEIAIPPLSSAFEGKSGKLLNLVHSFYALGAMLSPIIASFMIAQDLPYMAFLFIIAGYTCVPLYFSTRLKTHIPKREKKANKESPSEYLSLFKNKYFWIILTAIFFYVGSEASISSWAPTYSVDYRSYSKELSSLLPSLFWIGLFIGRFTSASWVDKVGKTKWLLIITSVGIPIAFFAQLPPDSFVFLAIFIFFSGLIHASIFPTLQSILVDKIKKNIGLALSIFSFSASAGVTLTSFIIGTLSSNVGLNAGYFVPFVMFFGVFTMIFVLSIYSKKTER
jgi:fucose permease